MLKPILPDFVKWQFLSLPQGLRKLVLLIQIRIPFPEYGSRIRILKSDEKSHIKNSVKTLKTLILFFGNIVFSSII